MCSYQQSENATYLQMNADNANKATGLNVKKGVEETHGENVVKYAGSNDDSKIDMNSKGSMKEKIDKIIPRTNNSRHQRDAVQNAPVKALDHNNGDEKPQKKKIVSYVRNFLCIGEKSGKAFVQSGTNVTNDEIKENEIIDTTKAEDPINDTDENGACGTVVKYNNRKYNEKTPIHQSNFSVGADITTLEEALKQFGLYKSFQKIEKSLTDVRNRTKTKHEHNVYLKNFDKQILNLCLRHHPDRVKSRGGSDEEIEEAKKQQAVLNAIRTFFNTVTKIFMEDIDADHMYGFYTKFNVTKLENEKLIATGVYDVFFKMSLLSEIKQERISKEVRNFLTNAKSCIKSYKDNHVPQEFMQYRDLSLNDLRCCIEGYKKLDDKFKEVEQKFKGEQFRNISDLLRKRAAVRRSEMKILKQVKKVALESLDGKLCIYLPSGVDDITLTNNHFVKPFVYYMNAILLCNAIVQKDHPNFFKSVKTFVQDLTRSALVGLPYIRDFAMFNVPYCLASRYSTTNINDEIMYNDMLQKFYGSTFRDPKEVKTKFDEVLKVIIAFNESSFKVENYAEGNQKDELLNEYMECLKLMKKLKDEKIPKETFIRLENEVEEVKKYISAIKDQQSLYNEETVDDEHNIALLKYVEQQQLKEKQDKVQLNDWQRNRTSKERQQVTNERFEKGKEQEGAIGILNYEGDRLIKGKKQVINKRHEEELPVTEGIMEYGGDRLIKERKQALNEKYEEGRNARVGEGIRKYQGDRLMKGTKLGINERYEERRGGEVEEGIRKYESDRLMKGRMQVINEGYEERRGGKVEGIRKYEGDRLMKGKKLGINERYEEGNKQGINEGSKEKIA